MTQIVENYGLHWDGAVAWLVQGRKGNNFVGLKGSCPFEVNGGMCNHMVPAAAPVPDRIHWETFMEVFPDPLVRAMLPIPHPVGEGVFYVEDPNDSLAFYLTNLSRLSSPIRNIIRPAWMMKMQQLEKELNTTNIQPLILTQVDQKSQSLVDTIGKLSMYVARPVILVGRPEVITRPPIQRIRTQIQQFDLSDLMMLPLENLGATLIRRYARREELDAPWETREDRRARQIRERS